MLSAPPSGEPQTLEESLNPVPAPEDFESFWESTLDELLEVDPHPRSVSLDLPPSGECVLAEMDSLGGAPVRIWFSGPKAHSDQAERPLLVTCHGYAGQTEAERVRRIAKFGVDVVAIDARGFGLSVGAVPRVAPEGYLLTGCTSPQESILRGAVCDYLQAYRAARTWFGIPRDVTFQGFSFAGGLAMMATGALALAAGRSGAPPLPQSLAPGAPTFGWLDKRLELCEAGSGRELADYLASHPDSAEQTKHVFRYFDTCYFAPYLSTKTNLGLERIIFGVGTHDPIVPAETVYAIKNALPQEPDLFVMPCSHTDRPEEAEWVRWEGAWLRAAQRSSQ